MKLDLATATTTEIKAAKGEYPIASDFWLVATWYAPDRRWKLWHHQKNTAEKAEELGAYLCRFRGHTHYTLIHVELPGAKI